MNTKETLTKKEYAEMVSDLWLAQEALEEAKETDRNGQTVDITELANEVDGYISGVLRVLNAEKIGIEEAKNETKVTNNINKIVGTSFKGYLPAGITFKTLTDIIGEPNRYESDGDGKIDVEWVIEFSGGKVATIYNYKNGHNYNGPDKGLDIEQITTWNVGGNCKEAHELVMDFLFPETEYDHYDMADDCLTPVSQRG